MSTISNVLPAVKAWLAKPATQSGLAALGSSVIGLLSQEAGQSLGTSVLVGSVAYAVIHFFLPKSTATLAEVEKTVSDGLAVVQGPTPAKVQTAVEDVISLAAASVPVAQTGVSHA